MRQREIHALALTIAALAVATRATAAVEPPRIETRFMYTLSSVTGAIPYSWASLSMDRAANELYVASAGIVDVFNDAGMSVYDFANDTGYGTAFAVAPLENGELVLLTRSPSGWALVRATFRGEPIAKLEISGMREGSGFDPSSVVAAAGKLYLADKTRMRVLVLGLDGKVQSDVDFEELLAFSEKEKADASMRAFDVDASGNMLFTISALFSAYVYSPEGKLRRFGTKGSTPGKFNIVGGITADGSGHVYVTDVLRCVVMVFSATDFSFLGEFGFRGYGESNLIAPLNVAVSNGKVYVTQSKGGVKVFGVQFEQ
jgi:outer membrane protein assembly factor BamB